MSTIIIIILVVLYLLGVFITPFVAFLLKIDIDDLILLAAWAWPIAIPMVIIYFLFSLPARIYDWLDISFDKDEDEDDSDMIPPIFNKRS